MTVGSVTEILRAATREIHSRIEETPFAKELLDGTLDRDSYVGYIRVLAVIHAAMERRLDACEHPLVVPVWRAEDLRRLPQLMDDNDFFLRSLVPDASGAVEAALRAASHILLMSRDNPVALLGCLYVLGGSTKGAVILAPRLAQALDLSLGQGLSYLTRHSDPGREEWDRAATVLDALVTDPADIEAMTQTALLIFQCVLEAFESLWPLNRASMKHMVTALNPESGTHPVPQDEDDLRAVLRASDRCLSQYPYFLYRYGYRGRRFSDSDGAWLATLPEQGADIMRGQIEWLGRLLSARGMPRLLLARHMQILAEELPAARPDQVERRALLTRFANEILDNLELRFPRISRAARTKVMEQALGRQGDFACAEAVELLASALVDEADGMTDAVENLMTWLAQEERFPPSWTQALNKALTALKRELFV